MVPLGTVDGLALQMEALGTAIRTIRHFKLKHWAMQMVCNWALQSGPLHCSGRCSVDSWVLHIGALGTAVMTTKDHWVLQLGQ